MHRTSVTAAEQSAAPRMSRLLFGGLLVLAVAAVGDIALHIAGGPTALETPAHVAVLAGMVATLAGVMRSGRLHVLSPPENKELGNAIR